jgi:hypothetical protein
MARPPQAPSPAAAWRWAPAARTPYANPGTYPVTITVTDAGGSTVSDSTTATVSPPTQSPITVNNPGSQSGAEGDPEALQIQASGGSGPLSYGASGLPAGLTIDSATGLISGTLAYTDAETQGGLYSVTVSAADNSGDSGSTTFNWSVMDTNTPPTLDNPGDLTNAEGDAIALSLSASDPDGDPITYGASGLPSGLTLDPSTGLISGVIAANAGAGSPYAVTVSASDGVNTVNQSFTWTITNVHIDGMADQDNLLGDAVSVGANAWDNAALPITYSASGLPPGLSMDPTTGLISGTIANTASVTTPYNVTVTASDGADSASTSFAWNVSSFTLDNPGDQTNLEGDPVVLQLGVESNGNPTLTYSASGLPSGLAINPSTGLIAGTLADGASLTSPYSVTVSASDGSATSSQTFAWTVNHVLLVTPADQINAPGDVVSLGISARDPDGDTLTYSASGLPMGLSINSTTGTISGTLDSTAGNSTPYSTTVTASDGTHTASATFNWTVSTSTGTVTVTNPGTQNNAELDTVSLGISASDSAGYPLTYSAGGLPAGLQIDPASGVISGTIDGSASQTNGGVYAVKVLADDGHGNSDSATFTWNVTHTNQAPTLDNPGDQVNQAGDVVSLSLVGSDADGDTLTYSASGLPAGLSVDAASGVISGTLPVSAGSSTPYVVTATVSDGTLSASQTFKWTVSKDAVTLTSPGNQSNKEGDGVSLQLSASDTDNSPLTYGAIGLPSGLSMNSATGLISGTIAAGAAVNGPYLVTVSAQDGAGHSDAKQFTWTVGIAGGLLTVDNPGNQINAQGDVLALQIQGNDTDGDTLTYSATGLPPGLSMDSSSGLISGVLSSTSASGSPYSVGVSVSDGSNSVSTSFTWTVTNGNVQVTNPGAQSNQQGTAASLQISATDSAQLPLTYSAAGLPPGLSINSSTGLISGTIDASAYGTYAASVSASDSAGNSGSASFTWTVTSPNEAPTLANPGEQLNKPGDAVSLELSGSDVDGDTLTYSAAGLPPGLSVDAATGIISGTLPASAASATPYVVTATVSDGSLSASQAFNWTVTQDVVTLTNPGDQTSSEGDSVSLQLSASDTNGSPLTYGASGLPSGLSINAATGLISGTVAAGAAANGPYAVTVSASDADGNSASQQFTWHVEAPDSLTLTNPDAKTNAEGDTVSLQLQGSDGDGDTLTYGASGLPIGLMIDPSTGLISGAVDYSAAEVAGGQYTVTVSVNDGNGHTANQTFTWTITDTDQGPWLAYPGQQENAQNDPASLQLDGGSPDGLTLTYSASGLPTGLTINASSGLISGTITATPGSYTVTASVSDGTKSASQTFTWDVTNPGPQPPHVDLAINNTLDHGDDVAIMDEDQPVPILVTLEDSVPGLHTVTISIPSGESTVDQPTLHMMDGGSETIYLTPVQASAVADDVLLVAFVDGVNAGDNKETNETVKFSPNVKAPDTPAGMPNRIPPRVWTKIQVTLGVDLTKSGEDLIYGVAGQSDQSDLNGKVVFQGISGGDAPRVFGPGSGPLWIKGTSQTKPPDEGKPSNAGNLKTTVSAYDRKLAQTGEEKASSAGFSVAAIPISVTESAWNPKVYEKNPAYGMRIRVTFNSDSKNVGDLREKDHIEALEKVIIEEGTGAWKNNQPPEVAQKDYLPIKTIDMVGDVDALTAKWILMPLVANATSTLKSYQAFIYKDLITGTKDIPIPESGFLRADAIVKPEKGVIWKFFVTNTASATTNTKLGIKVSAGILPRHVSYSQMLVENGLFSRRFWVFFVSSLRAGVISDPTDGIEQAFILQLVRVNGKNAFVIKAQ